MNPAHRQRFEDLFRRVMRIDIFREDLTMEDLVQWDSLKHVELLTEIDDAFQLDIDPTKLWKMASVRGILDVLSEYLD